MHTNTPRSNRGRYHVSPSRRDVFAWMLGSASLGNRLVAAEMEAPIRLGISESLLVDVNMNDARLAMQLWLKRVSEQVKVTIEISPQVFDPSEVILRRVRNGQLDALAMNILEYRQIADLLDSSELLVGAGNSGPDEYVLLVKRNSEYQQVAHLRGKRLFVSKEPKMCAAPAWLSTVLDEAHLGSPEEFFSSIVSETKVSRVVLPVFFGQTEACVTSRRGFETMCELNPQVGKQLNAIAVSAPLVVSFYAFLKGYRNPSREKFIRLHNVLLANSAGRQLATLFQFDELTLRNAGCLTAALSVLETADRARARRAAGNRKGQP